MGGIFINYRKGPQTVTIGALADRLEHYFGHGQVFVDNQMAPGVRYPNELKRRLLGSDVLVAVIHDGWTEEFKKLRSKDWVLFEIDTAMKTGIPVVPVLLEKVDPPLVQHLPAQISELAMLQVARVRGATYRADISHLVQRLERHVAPTHTPPPPPRVAPVQKPIGRRVIAWTGALSLLTPILLFEESPSWMFFSFPAFASACILSLMSILSMTLIPLGTRLFRPWDRAMTTTSFREAMSQRWILPAGGVFISAFFMINAPSYDTLGKWKWWLVAATILTLLYILHRMVRRYDAEDRAWPPTVSTTPTAFRRAAYRLHERLTTDPTWRDPRPRATQREAVSVYLRLTEARLDLTTRATVPLNRWIMAGYAVDTAAYLGWLISIVVLETAAVITLPHDSAPVGAYLVITVPVAIALLCTAAKLVNDRYSDRREVTRWIQELNEWQATLGPLIFCNDRESV